MLLTDAIERLEEELREAEMDRRSALRAAELHAERADMLLTAIAALRREKVRPESRPAEPRDLRDPSRDIASLSDGSLVSVPAKHKPAIRDEMRLPSATTAPKPRPAPRKLTMREAVEEILAEQDTVCAADIASRSGHPQNSCSTTLTLMLQAGELVRVSRGVYAAPGRKVRLG